MKKNNKKGFTLAELLIVVAIIAILVAIAIPAFSGSLNKAKVAADEANLRAAYAEVMAQYLTEQVSCEKTTQAMQYTGSVTVQTTNGTSTINVTSGKTVTVAADASGNITYTPAS